MSEGSSLSKSLLELSRFFVGDSTLEATLKRVSELTVDAIAPADLAGITMIVEGRKRTAVFTDPTSPEIDQAQYDTGEGPCLDAFAEGQVFTVESTRVRGRWQAFRDAAAAHGIYSTLSLPMIVNDDAVGAMNLYSHTEHGFTARDRDIGMQFAAQAAIVLANAQAYWDAQSLSSRLSESLVSRAVIEQAKGVLMGAQRCGPDEAFELLVRASQRENVKLREIAQRIIDNVTNRSDE